MKNFSDISNNLTTSKNKLIDEFTIKSGLDRDVVSKLYESTMIRCGNDAALVEEKFKSLLNVQLNTFETKIQELLTELKSAGTEISKSELINGFLNKCAQDTDEYNYYKVVLYILYLKDQINFNKLAACLETTTKLNEGYDVDKVEKLFESIPSSIDNGKAPVILGVNDGCEIKDDIRFYNGLKELLARNNKRWGNSYRIQNAHEAIINYLNQEIEELTNKDNITTVDQNFEETILKELFTGELNVMYRDINVLRPLIVDIQTLTFDMMCLVMSFVKSNSQYCKYLNRKAFDEFIDASNKLYGKIESSRKTSLLCAPEPDLKNKDELSIYTNTPGYIQIWQNIWVDHKKFDVYVQPIKVVAVVDALYIMKSCSVDFNLTIRKYINHFITKAFDVVGRLEKVILEAAKYNNNKNGVYC